MTIRVWDYLTEYADERAEILDAVDRVFKSGVLILGESGRRFEAEFAAYCGAAHGVGVDNATNGLFLAMKALGVGEGDEVVTVANTAVPTVSAIVQAGAVPRFVDVHEATGLMNASQLAGAISERTRCVIPVHLYGQMADMAAVTAVCAGSGVPVIEDCSQSHGATQHGVRCGAVGDLGVFSFYPTKPLGAYGDGGLITTNDEILDAKLRSLRFYGMKGVYYAEEAGYNSRLDEVQAEILRVKLPRLGAYIRRRQQIAKRYDEILSATSIGVPEIVPGNDHVYYVYVVRHPERDRLLAELRQRDILLNVSYPWPIHTMRGFERFGGKDGDLPCTESLSTRIMSLPMFPALSEAQQDTVCRAIGEVLGEPVSL